MIKIDDFIKSGTPLGIAIGIGATVFATAVIPILPALAKAARPTARAAIKSGILLAEKGREFMAEATEELEDILAEARAELQRENAKTQQPDSSEHAEVSTDQDDL
jgi:F0F1-type ATP synthase membrane subunit b/b'